LNAIGEKAPKEVANRKERAKIIKERSKACQEIELIVYALTISLKSCNWDAQVSSLSGLFSRHRSEMCFIVLVYCLTEQNDLSANVKSPLTPSSTSAMFKFK
jgi:hypothetical protein